MWNKFNQKRGKGLKGHCAASVIRYRHGRKFAQGEENTFFMLPALSISLKWQFSP
jgi:hypothetical protein